MADHSEPLKDPPFDVEPFRSLYPFEDRWWTHNGLRYHYLDEGYGEPLFMLHGNPTWSFYYRELIKSLKGEYRVITLDQMGCGLSERPDEGHYDYTFETRVNDIEAFLDNLELKNNLTLIAHDWGGVIGSAVAVRNPNLFSRFILMNTAAFRKPDHKRAPWQLVFVHKIPILPTILLRGFNLFTRIATRVGVEKRISKEIRRGYEEPYNGWRNSLATLRFVQDVPFDNKHVSYPMIEYTDRHLNRLVGKPMLICWGEKDFIFDMDILEIWKKRFPGADFIKYSDAGHFVLEDATDRMIEDIKRFLKKNRIGEGG
jgi:pimeloyl-ACP methyl ester carboxylesterase